MLLHGKEWRAKVLRSRKDKPIQKIWKNKMNRGQHFLHLFGQNARCYWNHRDKEAAFLRGVPSATPSPTPYSPPPRLPMWPEPLHPLHSFKSKWHAKVMGLSQDRNGSLSLGMLWYVYVCLHVMICKAMSTTLETAFLICFHVFFLLSSGRFLFSICCLIHSCGTASKRLSTSLEHILSDDTQISHLAEEALLIPCLPRLRWFQGLGTLRFLFFEASLFDIVWPYCPLGRRPVGRLNDPQLKLVTATCQTHCKTAHGPWKCVSEKKDLKVHHQSCNLQLSILKVPQGLTHSHIASPLLILLSHHSDAANSHRLVMVHGRVVAEAAALT